MLILNNTLSTQQLLPLNDADARYGRRGVFSPRHLAGPVLTTNAVTVATSSATAIASNVQVVGVSGSVVDKRILLTGGETAFDAATRITGKKQADSSGPRNSYVAMIETNAPVIECFSGGEGYCRYWVSGDPNINGGKRTLILDGGESVLNSGNNYRQFTFADSRFRVFEREGAGSSNFSAFRVTNADIVLKPTLNEPLMAFVGDSFTGAAGETTGSVYGTGIDANNLSYMSFAWEMARLLGCRCAAMGIGSTGYMTHINATPNPAYFATARVGYDVAPIASRISAMVVPLGYNDAASGVAVSNPTGLRAAVDQVLSDLKALLGDKPIMGIGPWVASTTSPGKGAADAGNVACNTILKAAYLAFGLPYASPIEGKAYDASGAVCLDLGGPPVSGDGYFGRVTGTPNVADTAVAADKIHPTRLGKEMWASFGARAFDAAFGLDLYSVS